MFPKKVHFYWGGSRQQMSWLRYMTLLSFRKMNPDWEMNLYVVKHSPDSKKWKSGEIQDSFDEPSSNCWDRLNDLGLRIHNDYEFGDMSRIRDSSPIQASDIFSWFILSSEGGLYSDMDILYIKPVLGLQSTLDGFDTMLCLLDSVDALPIGFMGSSGSNPIFQDAFTTSFNRLDREYQSAGTYVLKSLCQNNYRNFHARYPSCKIVFIGKEVVYHWGPVQSPAIFNVAPVPLPDSIGIHWYGGHPECHHFNKILNESNYQNYNCSFSFYAKQVLEQA